MSDDNRATPVAVCGESVPDGKGSGFGLTAKHDRHGPCKACAGAGSWEWTHDGYPADRSLVVGNHHSVTLP